MHTEPKGFLGKYVFSFDHKVIGMQAAQEIGKDFP